MKLKDLFVNTNTNTTEIKLIKDLLVFIERLHYGDETDFLLEIVDSHTGDMLFNISDYIIPLEVELTENDSLTKVKDICLKAIYRALIKELDK